MPTAEWRRDAACSLLKRGPKPPADRRSVMRIAQVAPLYERVPPRLYGGTERVVSWLTEELVGMGHDVTLFASGDSKTSAELVSVCPTGLRLSHAGADPLLLHMLMLERVAQRAHEFDVVHYHVDWLHFPLSRRLAVPQLTTLHGRLDNHGLADLYREFVDMPVVSISLAQRAPLPQARWLANVYHGLPAESLHFGDGGYLAFLGRISPEKRPDRAIEIARRAGMPLRMAAKIDTADRAYFEREIEPLLAQPHVEFCGEIGDGAKQDFLGKAAALLFPIDWPEPFGLVMIEAMACGTPVIGFPCGSVPEIVDEGASGFVRSTVADAADAARAVLALDRAEVRAAFDRRFSARRMARDYLTAYQMTSAVPRGRSPARGLVLHSGDVA